jgi:hypothetical protein
VDTRVFIGNNLKGENMYTDSQVRNISNIKQRLRATLTTWNGASREDNRKKFCVKLHIQI